VKTTKNIISAMPLPKKQYDFEFVEEAGEASPNCAASPMTGSPTTGSPDYRTARGSTRQDSFGLSGPNQTPGGDVAAAALGAALTTERRVFGVGEVIANVSLSQFNPRPERISSLAPSRRNSDGQLTGSGRRNSDGQFTGLGSPTQSPRHDGGAGMAMFGVDGAADGGGGPPFGLSNFGSLAGGDFGMQSLPAMPGDAEGLTALGMANALSFQVGRDAGAATQADVQPIAPIIPRELFLCGQRDLFNMEIVACAKLTAFLCVASNVECPSYVTREDRATGRVAFLHLPMVDNAGTDVIHYLARAFDFIDAARADGRAVVVYCQAGKSRSASVVAAYLMREFEMDFAAAMRHIRLTRPIVDPNIAFCMQLQSLEGCLEESVAVADEGNPEPIEFAWLGSKAGLPAYITEAEVGEPAEEQAPGAE
jgi:hypothetical protein